MSAKARVRAQRNAVVPGERMIGRQGFESEHVQSGARDMVLIQSLHQRALVDQCAAVPRF